MAITITSPYVCVTTYTSKVVNTVGCDAIVSMTFKFILKHRFCFFFGNDLCYVLRFVNKWFKPLSIKGYLTHYWMVIWRRKDSFDKSIVSFTIYYIILKNNVSYIFLIVSFYYLYLQSRNFCTHTSVVKTTFFSPIYHVSDICLSFLISIFKKKENMSTSCHVSCICFLVFNLATNL